VRISGARLGVSPKRNKRTLLALIMRPTSRARLSFDYPWKNPREISLIHPGSSSDGHGYLQIQRISEKRQGEDETDVSGNSFVDSATLSLASSLNCTFGLSLVLRRPPGIVKFSRPLPHLLVNPRGDSRRPEWFLLCLPRPNV